MKILYSLDFSQKDQKYVHLEMYIELEKYNKKELILLMPVWSPGSYLIREYSRHLDQFFAYDELDHQIKYERHHMVPCSYSDYETACNDELPDKWWQTYKKLG